METIRENNAMQTKKEGYDVYDIMHMLDISKNSAYKLIKSNCFKYITIGKMYRVPKASFDNWLNMSRGA